MDQEQRRLVRTLVTLAGIAALCAFAIFIAAAILIVREDLQVYDPSVGTPVQVGDQVVILYPVPDMAVRVVGESTDPTQPDGAQPTVEGGTGGQPQATPATQVPVATLPVVIVTVPPPTATPAPPSVIFVGYVVVPGDTLYGLTQKFNTSIDLMARYGIAANDMIAGNHLLLPVANPDFCPGSRPHVVRDQQTVSEIAQAYGTTPQAICAANSLGTSCSVKTSEVICVPY